MSKINTITIFLVFLASSCTVYQHMPTPVNVPVLDQKNQLQTNIGFDYKKGYLQMNYSVTNSMYLYTEGFYYKSQNSGWWETFSKNGVLDVDDYKSKIFQFKTGIGFFQNNDNLFVNFLGGAGFGNLEYEHGLDYSVSGVNYRYKANARNLELFLQPAIGLRVESYFDISFALRVKQETYYHVVQNHENDTDNSTGEKYDYLFYRPFNNFQFIEPALTCRFGVKACKLQLQAFRSFALQSKSLKSKELSLNMLVGITYTFGNKQQTTP